MANLMAKKGTPKRTLSPADEADLKALERAVKTMIEGPLSKWDHTRPLASLNRDDLRKIATAAITGWVLQRAEDRRWSETNEQDLNSIAVFVE